MSAGIRITTDSEAATTGIAARLAAVLHPGDIVLLSGPVGAGKSVFARGVVQHLLGRAEDVPSPTFTLVQRYDTKIAPLVHADLYRLKNSLELEETGLLDEPEAAIMLIEWPALLPDWFTSRALRIEITPDGAQRTLDLIAPAKGWTDRIGKIAVGS